MKTQATANTRNDRYAKAIIAMKLITKTENGYKIERPSFRGNSSGAAFTVEQGKCDCLEFEKNSDCPHVAAAEILAAAEIKEECFWCAGMPCKNGEDDYIPCAFCDAEPDILQIAAQQALNEKFALCGTDENLGGSWWNAFQKAEIELNLNKSIVFENGVLTLRSRGTGQKYLVTARGCSSNCKAAVASVPCYHAAIYAILANCPKTSNPVVYADFGRKTNPLQQAA